MKRYVLIPGAGGMASYWSRVVPLLEAAGHEAIAVDLPADDPMTGLPEYAALVRAAVADAEPDDEAEVVLVAQSLGGFTAALVATTAPISQLVFVNAMIPVPGETPGQWWDTTGAEPARWRAAEHGGYSREVDLDTYFLHDVPPEVLAAGEGEQRLEAAAVFDSTCDFREWPDIPIAVVSGADDRFFPLAFQRRVARQRLGCAVDPLPGGHLMALSHPAELADYLLALPAGARRPRRAAYDLVG